MDVHAFTPSRPDGTVCVLKRRVRNTSDAESLNQEVCGYPAGHPIHALATPAQRAPYYEVTADVIARIESDLRIARAALDRIADTIIEAAG